MCIWKGLITLRIVRFVLALSPRWGEGSGPWQPSDIVTYIHHCVTSSMAWWKEQGVLKLDLDWILDCVANHLWLLKSMVCSLNLPDPWSKVSNIHSRIILRTEKTHLKDVVWCLIHCRYLKHMLVCFCYSVKWDAMCENIL